ncbi:hypothetical protein [Myceligenerans indicum]|uniref:Uncharacterized protein n=1 Tax=Myceligenerans indicum TaxID=2593663 RepID=A0ABS1LJQ2_9MICO|nr:hypothetical protein [Myceligenerans indicum]MBL0886363.1 hypothetical protein [Myceligenerans indicum]
MPTEANGAPEEEAAQETQDALAGTRDRPLKKGEARQISEQSAFTISFGETESYGEDCLSVPVKAQVDWEILEEQMKSNGKDTTNISSIPFFSVTTAFVTEDGKSYDSMRGDACMDAFLALDESLTSVQEIYPPATAATDIRFIQVPEDERAGGAWVAENSLGEKVFGEAY